MARKSDNGCGLLILAAVVILALGRCGKGAEETATPPAPVSLSDANLNAKSAPTTMYVGSKSLSCREAANADAPVLEKLRFADEVTAIDVAGLWSQVRTQSAGMCWALTKFLTDEKPSRPKGASRSEPADRPQSLFTDAAPKKRRGTGNGFSCGDKSICRQMNSCAEAMHYLNECGMRRLDRDDDGIPCESIC